MFKRRDRSRSSSITVKDLLLSFCLSHFGDSDPTVAPCLRKESTLRFRCHWPSILLPACRARRIGWPEIPDGVEVEVTEDHSKAFRHRRRLSSGGPFKVAGKFAASQVRSMKTLACFH